MILRDFLYLDRTLVRDFLAQAEGGLVDETTERQRSAGKGGVGGRAGVGPLQVSAEKSKDHSTETEAVVHQSGPSEFDRLYNYLNGDDLVVFDEVSDPAVLGSIQRKQILEVDARVKLAGLHQLLDLTSKIVDVAPMMQQLGGADLDQEALDGMKAISALESQRAVLPLIATVAGAAGLKIALELNPDFIHTDAWDVEATVLFKVQRILKASERYTVGDPFGGLLKMLPEADRAQFMASMKDDQLAQFGIGDIEISDPGLIATPIAIYR